MTTQPDSSTAGSPWAHELATLRTVKPEIPGVFTCEFELATSTRVNPYAAKPGQFNMLYCPGYGEAAISLSRVELAADRLVHTIRAVGDVTNALSRLRPGRTIGLRGPFGNGWPENSLAVKDLVIVAGGIGMAPLRPVVESHLKHPGSGPKITVLIGARSSDRLLFSDEYADWRRRGALVSSIVDRPSPGWNGDIGVVANLLYRMAVDDPLATQVFLCGPELMMRHSAETVLSMGIPSENVWLSMERHINCGIGHCGRCQFGGRFVCTEGPVFQYSDIRAQLSIPGV